MKYGLKEDLAIALSHYIFRDTEIEDFHSKCVKMDFEFYLESVDYFGQIVNQVNRNKKIVSLFLKDNWEKVLVQKLQNGELKTNIQKRLCLCLSSYLLMIPDWDKPIILNEKPCRGIIRYLLRGKYAEHCANESILDDKTMCEINHDFCNRIYTLIENGWVDIDK